MIRFTLAICTWWLSLTGISAAQPLAGTTVHNEAGSTLVKMVAAPQVDSEPILPPMTVVPTAKSQVEKLSPTPVAPAKSQIGIVPPALPAPAPYPNAEAVPSPSPPASPGEAMMTREARAHEQYLLQSQAQAESVHRAAVARFEQRMRRLESQRWFGISNSRPLASPDPLNDDYSPGWVSNNPFYPFRWVGSAAPWGFVECQ